MKFNCTLVLSTLFYLCHSKLHETELDVEAVKKAHVAPFTIAPFSVCHVVDKLLGLKHNPVNVSLAGVLGRSFDPLTDKSYYPILEESFTACQKTPDSRFYIPNNYRVMFIMSRKLDISAQLSTNFNEAKDSSSLGGSVRASGTGDQGSGGGTAAGNYENTKKKMEKKSCSMYQMSVINDMYRLTGDMSAPFTKNYANRLKPIIDAIEKFKPLKARYLVQKLLNDYGTHVTMEATMGTRLIYKAFVKTSYVTADETMKTKVSAQATLTLKNCSGDGSGRFKKGNSESTNDESFEMQLETWAMGGAELKKLHSPDAADAFDDSYPVAINREIYPIYMMMNSGSMNYKATVEAELRRHFEDATNEYFERNRIGGCTDKNKINYDYQASIDDGTCGDNYCNLIPLNDSIAAHAAGCQDLNELDHSERFKKIMYCARLFDLIETDGFIKVVECGLLNNKQPSLPGGIYQTCEQHPDSKQYDIELEKLKKHRPHPCKKLRVPNIFTGSTSCPSDQTATKIIEYEYVLPDVHIVNSTHFCFDATTHNCTIVRADIILRDKVILNTYWCSVKGGSTSIGFGGFFDRGQINNFNGERTCSPDMLRVTLFHGTTLCLTMPSKNVAELTLLYSNHDRRVTCPIGHSRQLITVINFKKIYGCILKNHAYYDLDTPAVIKGPYLDKRFAEDGYDQSYLTIKHGGQIVDRKLLDEIGDKIYAYLEHHLEVLRELNKPTTHGAVTLYVSKNWILLVIGAILFIVCLFAVIWCLF